MSDEVLPRNLKEYINDPNLNLISLDDGSVVSQRVLDLIETIEQRWFGQVKVNWIPPRALKEGEDQFCIVELLANGREAPILWVKDELAFTGEIIEKLIASDNSSNNVYDRMQTKNAAARAIQKKLAKDKMDEKNDIARHVLRSHLNTYRLGKGRVIKDYGNRTH